MVFKLLKLELKSFFRKPQWAAGIAMKIGMFFILAYTAMIFFGGAFGLYYGAKEAGQNPIQLFCEFFLLYWFLDLALKYFIQQLPANNIKPFLTQKITKNEIVKYTLIKILFSYFTWVYFLFIIPFTVLLLLDKNFETAGVLGLSIGTSLLVFINAFVNIIINKKTYLVYCIFGISILLGALHYFKVIDVLAISQELFYSFYKNPLLLILPLLAFVFMWYFSFVFIKRNLYLDKGLEMKKTVGKTENIAFLNKYGSLGTFINNDIRLIKRSKAARAAAVGGILFLFYGLLYFNSGYHNSFMQSFLGIFVTGGFMFMFGQRVPAWDSSYYPLMMTQNVPYKEYLKAKWSVFVLAILLSMILSIGYAYISWEFYFTIFAAGLYNLGVNSYLTLFAGAFNKKPIDLNSAAKGFTAGQNNFNLKLILLMIPQMLLPMAVFSLSKYFLGMTAAVISLGLLGMIGFFLRDKIFDLIVKTYKTEKYSTIAAFKKID